MIFVNFVRFLPPLLPINLVLTEWASRLFCISLTFERLSRRETSCKACPSLVDLCVSLSSPSLRRS